MPRFIMRYEENKDRSILHLGNFLLATQLMSSIEEVLPLVHCFIRRGEDVVVEIPDALKIRFLEAMEAVSLKCEEIK
jgi:hypothetical protein